MNRKHDFDRRYDRKVYGAHIVFAHENNAYAGTLKNISLGGAFISTRSVRHVSTGDKVTVSIPFTSGAKHVKRIGLIKWLNKEGFAIEFL